MLGRIRSLLAKNDGPYTMMDAHDDWNLLAIGGLNLAHVAWWFGLVATNGPALQFLFYADCDTCWPTAAGCSLFLHASCHVYVVHSWCIISHASPACPWLLAITLL